MALWTPASIAKNGWYDAATDASVTLVSGVVSQWSDLSGANRHWTQGTAARRPRYAVVAEGLPALIFRQHEFHFLQGNNGIRFNGDNYFYFVVATHLDNRTISYARCVMGAGTPGTQGLSLMVAQASADGSGHSTPQSQFQWRFEIADGSDGATQRQSVYSGAGPANGGNRSVLGFGAEPNGAEGNFFRMEVHGVLTQRAQRLRNGSTSNAFYLGRAPATTVTHNTTQYFEGHVHEVLALNYYPNDALRAQITGYLAHKWGTAHALPHDHPFKWFPPQTEYKALSGIIHDHDGNPCQRTIHVHRRETWERLASVHSDPITGQYEVLLPDTEEVVRMVLAGEEPPLLNDKVARIIPG